MSDNIAANPIVTPLSGGGGVNNPLIATVSGLFGKFMLTGWGFAKKGSKVSRHSEALAEESFLKGTKGICHSEGETRRISMSWRNFINPEILRFAQDDAKGIQHGNPCVIASVQRDVAIASDRDLREQNTECAVRRSNDAVGAVPIHSNVRFSFFGSFSFFLHHNKKKEMNKKRDCFATLAMTGKKAFAFTLAEVLIVLVVLGVIAAMTIPDLIQDANEKALITALKKSYTIFEQAIDMATVENGPVNTWDIGTEGSSDGSQKLYDILEPYLRISEGCGDSRGCFADHYEALFNENFANQPLRATESAKGVLASGVSFLFYSRTTGCPKGFCGDIYVDVNGKAGPNKAGVDYFDFQITEDGLYPMGKIAGATYGCIYNYTGTYNGLGCTYWALKRGNMDYLRKAGDYSKP